MYLRFIGLCFLGALLSRLVRAVQPSRYGLVFGVLLLYIPMMVRFPVNFGPGLNLLTLFLLTLFFMRGSAGEPPRGPQSRAFRGLLYGWMAVGTVGFVLGTTGPTPWLDLLVLFKRWLDPLFASLLALYISRQEDRKFVLACLLIGYALVGLQATREGLDIGDKIRIVGLLDQPNDLGAFLAMYAPVALVSAFFLTSGPLRYALLGCVVLGGWGLIFTQSRAALLAFPVGILVVLFASGRGGLGFLGLVLAVLVWAFPGILPEQATARFASTYVEKAAGATTEQLDPSAAERLVIWQGAANIIATHPLGVGFAQFQHVIGQYAHLVGRARDAHNFYLLIGAELGVGGLLLLFSSLQKMLTTAWAVTRRATDEFLQVLGLGLFAALLTTLVVNCFGSRLLTVQVSTYLWVLSATVIGAYDSLAETGTPSSAATAKTREPRSRFRVNAWGLRSPRRTHSEV